jgi:hypothetical protein
MSEMVVSGGGASELESARVELEGWRADPSSGGQIPASAWEKAVHAARTHGIHTVSRALGLSYSVSTLRTQWARRLPQAVGSDLIRHFCRGLFSSVVTRPLLFEVRLPLISKCDCPWQHECEIALYCIFAGLYSFGRRPYRFVCCEVR